MSNQNSGDYTFYFESSFSIMDAFDHLLDVRRWWTGLHAEIIKGDTKKNGDEFTFSAGDGAHYSKQKLVELIPGKKIVWLVTDSHLSFLEKPNEWTGTKICFEISEKNDKSSIIFTHEGLNPEVACYNSCAPGWTQYLQILAKNLT